MVQAMGAKNMLLSPPKKIFGSYDVNRPAKSMLKPMAIGINHRMVVIAVRRTGRRLVFSP